MIYLKWVAFAGIFVLFGVVTPGFQPIPAVLMGVLVGLYGGAQFAEGQRAERRYAARRLQR